MTKVNGEKIQISTDEVMKTVSGLDESLNLLEGTMSNSIKADFNVISKSDLFSDSISKIKEQISSLENSNKNLITKITMHADDVEKLEQNIIDEIEKSLIISDGAGQGGAGNYYSDISDIKVDNVEENKTILNGDLLARIPDMKEFEQKNFISFININKGEYTINDLLLNNIGAGMLVYLLKKFYGDNNNDINNVSTNTNYNIQKALLEKILQTENGNETIFNRNSIIIAKDYFHSVAKNNNIAISELLLNDNHKQLLMNSIKDLYENKNIEKYNVKEETITNVKQFIDELAEENNIEVNTLFSDLKYLDNLK